MVDIRLGEEFKRQFKRLKKKYPSLTEDLKIFSLDLRANPQQGVPLGARLYKVRMAIAAKGKGEKWWCPSDHLSPPCHTGAYRDNPAYHL